MAEAAVATTVICGPLGVGKTTAILDLLARRGDGRFAVLVNEAGQVGIDGATMAADGITVREVAGGCMCCVAGPMLQVALVRLLREVRPTRLLIEPSGLAMPGAIVDMLRRPGLREAVALRATVGLVDPASCARRYGSEDVARAQVDAADVLVANRTDRCRPEVVAGWEAWAGALWPPKLVVATTTFGRLDPTWIDLDPAPTPAVRAWQVAQGEEARSWGHIWPPEVVFERPRLMQAVQGLVADGGDDLLRLKGLFHTTAGWVRIDGLPDEVRVWPTSHRRDSRVEVLSRVELPGAAGAFEGARQPGDVG